MLSVQARLYIGMAMMTSSQAWTVPARHRDMGTVRAISTCCSLSSCSSPSDRLALRRPGLDMLSESESVDEGKKAGLYAKAFFLGSSVKLPAHTCTESCVIIKIHYKDSLKKAEKAKESWDKCKYFWAEEHYLEPETSINDKRSAVLSAKGPEEPHLTSPV